MRNNLERLGQPSPPDNQGAPSVSGLNYSVPTEFVSLPSRGKLYSEEHPLHNQEVVEIRYMTAKEEDILASISLIEKGLVIDRLLENILVLDIDPRTLLLGDRAAIMIAARVSAYGNAYTAQVTCSECQEQQKYNFDLKKVNLNEECFNDDFLRSNKITFNEKIGGFNVQLPVSNVTLGVKMLTADIEDSISGDDESEVTSALRRLIVSVEGKNDPQIVTQFVSTMLASDSRYLRVMIPSLTPSIDLKQTFVCKECKHEEAREVPLTAEFFWPR